MTTLSDKMSHNQPRLFRKSGQCSFRRRFRDGKPNRAAILWATIKGYWQDGLTEAGRKWVGAGGLTGRADPADGAPAARKAGKAGAGSPLRTRLLLAEAKARRGGERRDVEAGSAQQRGGDRAGLRKERSSAPRGRENAVRDRAASQVWDGANVARSAPGADWRALRAENARRNGL